MACRTATRSWRIEMPASDLTDIEAADRRGEEFQRLRAASARMGRDPLLIQSAGGNTSLKTARTMTIKAWGTWLQDAETADIFVDVDLVRLLSAIAAEETSDDMSSFVTSSTLRSSIEMPVHAVMPQAVVLHIRHVDTIALAVVSVIFLGPGLSVLVESEALEDGVRRLMAGRGQAPVTIAVPGAGVLMARNALPAAHALARCLADVAARIPEDASLRLFDEREVHALVPWDAEVYRQSLTRAGE